MDELARRYLLLVLRLARHRADVLAAWLGPPELPEAVAGETPAPPRELHDEALLLGELLAQEPVSTRARWLAAQLRAVAAIARALDGEEIGYLDLVEELYDTPLRPEPEDTFRAAHAMLDAALDPGAGLRERLAAHRAATTLRRDAALAASGRLIAVFRRRADDDLWLPPGEALEVEPGEVTGARYLGRLRSRLTIAPTGLPLLALVRLVARETYPGRHLERSTKALALVSQRRWLEAAADARHTPAALVSDGIAEVGREVLLGDQELGVELGRIARAERLPTDPARELAVARAEEHLGPAVTNAAIALHHDSVPPAAVRDYLAEVALLPDEEIETSISCLADPLDRATPVLRFAGLRLFREWLQVQGQTSGLARALTEPLTPGLLRAEADVS